MPQYRLQLAVLIIAVQFIIFPLGFWYYLDRSRDLSLHKLSPEDSRSKQFEYHTMATKMPALYLTHGGGPMPLLNHPSHKSLIAFFKSVRLPTPKALLVISGHWEV